MRQRHTSLFMMNNFQELAEMHFVPWLVAVRVLFQYMGVLRMWGWSFLSLYSSGPFKRNPLRMRCFICVCAYGTDCRLWGDFIRNHFEYFTSNHREKLWGMINHHIYEKFPPPQQNEYPQILSIVILPLSYCKRRRHYLIPINFFNYENTFSVLASFSHKEIFEFITALLLPNTDANDLIMLVCRKQ